MPDRFQRFRAAFILHCSEFACVPSGLARFPLSDFGISKVNPPSAILQQIKVFETVRNATILGAQRRNSHYMLCCPGGAPLVEPAPYAFAGIEENTA